MNDRFTGLDRALALHAVIIAGSALLLYALLNCYIYFFDRFFESMAAGGALAMRDYKIGLAAYVLSSLTFFALVIGYGLYFVLTTLRNSNSAHRTLSVVEWIFDYIRTSGLWFIIAFVGFAIIGLFLPWPTEASVREVFEREVVLQHNDGLLMVISNVIAAAVLAALLWVVNFALGKLSLLLQFVGVMVALATLSGFYAMVTAELFVPGTLSGLWQEHPIFIARVGETWRSWAEAHQSNLSPFASTSLFSGVTGETAYADLFIFYADSALSTVLIDIPQIYRFSFGDAELNQPTFLLSSVVFSFKLFVAYLFVPLAFRVLRPFLPRTMAE